MIYLVVAAYVLALAALGSVAGLAHIGRQAVREHARERQLLVNQILHLSGRTWQPPPTPEPPPPTSTDYDGNFLPPDRFVMSPGQEPDNDFNF